MQENKKNATKKKKALCQTFFFTFYDVNLTVVVDYFAMSSGKY